MGLRFLGTWGGYFSDGVGVWGRKDLEMAKNCLKCRVYCSWGDIFLAIAIFGYPGILYKIPGYFCGAIFSLNNVYFLPNLSALESWDVRLRVNITFCQIGPLTKKLWHETFGYIFLAIVIFGYPYKIHGYFVEQISHSIMYIFYQI